MVSAIYKNLFIDRGQTFSFDIKLKSDINDILLSDYYIIGQVREYACPNEICEFTFVDNTGSSTAPIGQKDSNFNTSTDAEITAKLDSNSTILLEGNKRYIYDVELRSKAVTPSVEVIPILKGTISVSERSSGSSLITANKAVIQNLPSSLLISDFTQTVFLYPKYEKYTDLDNIEAGLLEMVLVGNSPFPNTDSLLNVKNPNDIFDKLSAPDDPNVRYGGNDAIISYDFHNNELIGTRKNTSNDLGNNIDDFLIKLTSIESFDVDMNTVTEVPFNKKIDIHYVYDFVGYNIQPLI